MAEVLPSVEGRFITSLGPIKLEVLNLSGTLTVADSAGNPSSTTQTGVDDADTVKSLLQRPLFALGSIVSDAVTISQSFNVGISGKTLTINATDLAADNIVILVFGF